MLDFELDDELDSYAATPDEADRESARRTLIRMFPELDEEELIELEEGKLMRLTVNRVLETMLHNNGPGFTLNRTFSNEVFYRSKEEAYDMMLWLDTEEDTPKPSSLVYKAPEVVREDTPDEEDAQTAKVKETRPNPGPYNRRTRGVSLTSKYQRAKAIVDVDLKKSTARQDTIKGLIETFGLNKATAESYYSKAKAEIEG